MGDLTRMLSEPDLRSLAGILEEIWGYPHQSRTGEEAIESGKAMLREHPDLETILWARLYQIRLTLHEEATSSRQQRRRFRRRPRRAHPDHPATGPGRS